MCEFFIEAAGLQPLQQHFLFTIAKKERKAGQADWLTYNLVKIQIKPGTLRHTLQVYKVLL